MSSRPSTAEVLPAETPRARRFRVTKKRLAVGAAVGATVSAGLLVAGALPAFAQETVPPDLATLQGTVDTTVQTTNLLWIVIGAVLVIFMQAGFALVETGFCRAKHAAPRGEHELRHLRPGLRGVLPRRASR